MQRSSAPSRGLGFERGAGFKRVLSGYCLAGSPFDPRGITFLLFQNSTKEPQVQVQRREALTTDASAFYSRSLMMYIDQQTKHDSERF